MVETHDVDLFNTEMYGDGIPYDVFDRLRREQPVYRQETGFQPLYSITRHADVVAVHRDPETFSSEKMTTYALTEPPVDLEAFLAEQRMMMLNMDDPAHARLRKLVSSGFAPGVIRKLTDHLANEGRQIVEKAVEKGDVEFVEEVAAELPLIAICEFIGVPKQDRKRIYDLTNKLIGGTDPEFVVSAEERMGAAMEMFAYAQEIADSRRNNLQGDIASTLLSAEIDGEKLSDLEFNLFFMLLGVAGSETTRNALTHGLHALLAHPDQLAMLRDDPSKIDRAIEEILRWGTPVMQFRRQTTRPVTLSGVEIPEDSGVVVWYTSANRDETVFEDPYRFNVERRPNNHVTFGGGGPHFCLGANLARTEMKIILSELLRQADIEQLAEPRRLESNFINGVKQYKVRLTPRQ